MCLWQPSQNNPMPQATQQDMNPSRRPESCCQETSSSLASFSVESPNPWILLQCIVSWCSPASSSPKCFSDEIPTKWLEMMRLQSSYKNLTVKQDPHIFQLS
jgi:hypothetical protein